jgi:short-subunit dehydrogenase
MAPPPKSILITGASSGLGAALAREYAGPGVRLFLTGRDRVRLDAVSGDCRTAGAEVVVRALDVLDAAGFEAWIREVAAAGGPELAIANAGMSAGTGEGTESSAQARRIFATNLDGVLNTVLPVAALMAERGSGQIAIMSSLAAFRGFPGAPAYCASKAAVRVWGEALRGDLHRYGVSVSVICPGYVRTPMTAVNRFPMPFLMSAERAARIVRRGLARDRARIAFPWPMYAAVRLLSALPTGLVDPLLRRLPAKS